MKVRKSIFFGFMLLSLVLLVAEVEKTLADNARVVKNVPTAEKIVALTFDDGPSKRTREILATLRAKDVQATFFVVGEMAERFPQLVSEETAAGHEIGNHTFTHANLRRVSRERMAREIERTDELIRSQSGIKCELFRPPGGIYDHSVLEEAARRNYVVVLWSVDSHDWCSSGERIVESVVASTKPGAIILLHDGLESTPTSKVLPLLIDRLKDRGYRFVTVSELLHRFGSRPKCSLD